MQILTSCRNTPENVTLMLILIRLRIRKFSLLLWHDTVASKLPRNSVVLEDVSHLTSTKPHKANSTEYTYLCQIYDIRIVVCSWIGFSVQMRLLSSYIHREVDGMLEWGWGLEWGSVSLSPFVIVANLGWIRDHLCLCLFCFLCFPLEPRNAN